jgi:hypothetical protein
MKAAESASKRPPRLQGGGQRAVVEVVEFAADRHALGEARELDAGPGGAVGDVVRGSLAFDRRIQGQDQFLARFQSGNQAVDRQILGADAVERRQGSAQHVIAAAKGAGAFERPKIREILDDADDAVFTPGVAADRTGLDRVEIAADRARANRLGRFGQRRSERRQKAFPPLDQVQRRAPSRAGAEARKLGEQLDQEVEFRHGSLG